MEKTHGLNIEDVLEKYAGVGTRVESTNPDGSIVVVDQAGNKNRMDINGLLKKINVDPNAMQMTYNKPESAKMENALGFTKQAGMIFAKTPKQQLGYLQREFGEENVVQDGDSFKVKDADGFWKKADSSWYNEIAASSPLVAASIAGTIKGAAVGMAAGPAGSVVGGILGGAASAALAQYGEQKFAEMAGVRTEQDAMETASEVGRDMANNIIWDVATFGAGKVLKGINPFNRMKLANVLGGAVQGTKPDDWMVVTKSAEDAMAARKWAELNYKQLVSGDMQSELLPATKAMAATFGKSIQTAQKVAERNYEYGLKQLEGAGVLDYSHMPIDSVRNGLIDDLSKAGLMSVDNVGNPVFKSKVQLASSATDVVDETAQQRLKQVFTVVDDIYKKQVKGVPGATSLPNKPELQDLLTLKRHIGAVSKNLGHFANPASVSDSPKRILSKATAAADRIFNIGANHVTTKIGGRPAGEVFKEMNSKYSDFRTGYDFIAAKAKKLDIEDLGNTKDLAKMVSTLDSENGAHVLQAYKTMADSIGSNDMYKRLTSLRQMKAGAAIASGYGGAGNSGAIKTILGIAPKTVGGIVTDASESIHKTRKLIPPQVLSPLIPIAKGNEFLRKLSKTDRAKMLVNNDMLSSFLQTITDFQPIQQQAEQELMNQVP